jgi:hypothetical protein
LLKKFKYRIAKKECALARTGNNSTQRQLYVSKNSLPTRDIFHQTLSMEGEHEAIAHSSSACRQLVLWQPVSIVADLLARPVDVGWHSDLQPLQLLPDLPQTFPSPNPRPRFAES